MLVLRRLTEVPESRANTPTPAFSATSQDSTPSDVSYSPSWYASAARQGGFERADAAPLPDSGSASVRNSANSSPQVA